MISALKESVTEFWYPRPTISASQAAPMSQVSKDLRLTNPSKQIFREYRYEKLGLLSVSLPFEDSLPNQQESDGVKSRHIDGRMSETLGVYQSGLQARAYNGES